LCKFGLEPLTKKNLTKKLKVYDKFGMEPLTIDFVGHCMALYPNDQYRQMSCGATINKIKLYMSSFLQYGNSPFIYPLYGLGGLPEGFSRLSAVHGGTYMLNTPVDGFEFENPDGTGRITGVRSNGQIARSNLVICDPSYVAQQAQAQPALAQKINEVGQVIRAICILSK
jgi:Rab GDP dissociation inhibitor